MITAMPRIAIAVSDYGAAISTFQNAFGMPVVDFSGTTVPELGAHVGMCVPEGGSNIEIMAPSNPEAPLSQSLNKFLARRGDGLYALMLEAADPDAEAEELAGRGLQVLPLMAGAGGRDLHPRSTHGVLIRVYPIGSAGDLSGHQSKSPYLSGIVKVVIATDDAEAAGATYGAGLGLAIDPPVDDEHDGVRRVICRPPAGGVIELVSPLDVTGAYGRRINDFVSERGRGMFELVLAADEPKAAAVHLRDRGIEMTDNNGLGTVIHGAPIRIE